MIKSLGVCVGASTIKFVSIDDQYNILERRIINHDCHPKQALIGLFEEIDIKTYTYAVITGRKFKDLLAHEKITEPIATEYALRHFKEKGLQGPRQPWFGKFHSVRIERAVQHSKCAYWE